MKRIQRGTPLCGVISGLSAVLVLTMLLCIGLWKTLLYAVIFGIAFYLGAAEHPVNFLRSMINSLISRNESQIVKYEKKEKEDVFNSEE